MFGAIFLDLDENNWFPVESWNRTAGCWLRFCSCPRARWPLHFLLASSPQCGDAGRVFFAISRCGSEGGAGGGRRGTRVAVQKWPSRDATQCQRAIHPPSGRLQPSGAKVSGSRSRNSSALGREATLGLSFASARQPVSC